MKAKIDEVKYSCIDVKKTGELIRSLMDEYDIKPIDLVENNVVGTIQTVYAWYYGKAMPNHDTLLYLSRLFNCHVEALMVDDETTFNFKKGGEMSL